MNERKFSLSEIRCLWVCYNSPTNEHNDIDFVDYIELAISENVIDDLFYDMGV